MFMSSSCPTRFGEIFPNTIQHVCLNTTDNLNSNVHVTKKRAELKNIFGTVEYYTNDSFWTRI